MQPPISGRSRDKTFLPQTVMMTSSTGDKEYRRLILWLAACCVLTILAYLPGLSGPFLFDDISNLSPMGPWLAGDVNWQQVLLGNNSGIFGRPLAMLSFMFNALLFGGGPLSFKITNLFIHIGCGVLVFFLCRRLFRLDERVRGSAPWWALAIAAVWLLHPMQVSTVLYIVQRMAQLSAAFVLIALLCYVHGRALIESGRLRTAAGWLFVAFPVATLAAALCKENGVLAPLFAIVLELAYFRGARRPRLVNAFFVIFLLIPGVLVAGWYALQPQKILAGYAIRDFTFAERLLTEPRVLLDYLASLLLPRGASLGLYGDDFPLSTGWLTPISTVFAMAFWLGAAVGAWLLRRRSPTFCAGVFVFLAGHVMESSVFSLEIYFEHRNYLPSLGIFMAVAGLLEMGYARLRNHVDFEKFGSIAVVLLVLGLAVATHMRAWSWQSWGVLVSQAAAAHPDSMRAQMDMAALYIKSGQYDQARAMFAKLRSNTSLTARSVGAIYPVVLDCQILGAADPAHMANLRAIAGTRFGHYETQAIEMLVHQLDTGPCQGLSNAEFAAVLSNIASKAPQRKSVSMGTLHHMAADFYNRSGDSTRARDEAQAAWSTGTVDASAGRLLARLLIIAHDYDEAEHVIGEIRERTLSYDTRTREMTNALAAELLSARQTTATKAP